MKWSVKKGDVEHNNAAEHEQTDVVVAADNAPVQTEEQAALLELKVSIHRLLLDKINLGALEKLPRAAIRVEIAEIIGEMLAERREKLNRTEREALVDDVLDELLGLGPLEPLLQDESITDILVNGPKTVFVERFGKLERAATTFQDERHLMRIIQKIVSAVGRRIDESRSRRWRAAVGALPQKPAPSGHIWLFLH